MSRRAPKEVHFLSDDNFTIPPLSYADEDGLIALSFDFSVDRILHAYVQGAFPYFQAGNFFHWYAPQPRCVIYPEECRIPKSMKQVMRNGSFEFKCNTEFESVMEACAMATRKPAYVNGVLYPNDQTWINYHYVRQYTALHHHGFGISGEAWQDGQLVGGCYGVLLGKVFFGESMFSSVSNASKFAFFSLVKHLQQTADLQIIDCQMPNDHLMTLGARIIPIEDFMAEIKKNTAPIEDYIQQMY
jgi:leucyl/phenylalanyl-tRNA---protein transferase